MSGTIKLVQRILGWVSFLLIFTTFSFVLGCGGGGGGDSSTDESLQSETTFTLPRIDLSVGYTEAWDISGTAISTLNRNNTATVSGSLQIEVLDIEDYQGERAYPVEQLVNLSIDGNPRITDLDTHYYDINGNPIAIVDASSGDVKTPITINHKPDIADIGDFGQLTSWRNSADGSEQHSTWRLEGAGGDKADYIETRTVRDRYGNVDQNAEIECRIDTNGKILRQTRIISDYENNIEYDVVYTQR